MNLYGLGRKLDTFTYYRKIFQESKSESKMQIAYFGFGKQMVNGLAVLAEIVPQYGLCVCVYISFQNIAFNCFKRSGICSICLADMLAFSPSIRLNVIATIKQGQKCLSVQWLARLLPLSNENVFTLCGSLALLVITNGRSHGVMGEERQQSRRESPEGSTDWN